MKNHEFMNEKEVSKWLGVAVQTLRNWRSTGERFPYYKIGRRVVYLRDEVLECVLETKITRDERK